ncbi:Delta-1-pyrroline-5-carboxylate dehydrogenase, mitochondrial-like [Oopsacas minuta]|uniref:Delta-1-pyrroline-5-carboxylate dehydrogenase, mitochondrial-like n=1 Tax=Oopsacas minuta TaxID=111878 RepID=A0AAV7K2B5_9METZ|nr:Delta-1-pyrroline-5-carboxylate dehydrogenase, mitochondrial-like [Oopsacas minuta]
MHTLLRRPVNLKRLARSFSGVTIPPRYKNEPISSFLPGTEERALLKQELEDLKTAGPVEIPLVIGGEEIHTENKAQQLCPYQHDRIISEVSLADENHIDKAIKVALHKRKEWELTPFDRRAAVFLKAADLLAGKYRNKVLAATMIGQGKTAFQAEIDATCELIDFFRFGVQYAQEIYSNQPELHSPGVWNRLMYRGLEGFIAAISPFNFTAIGGNLGGTPAIMGNVILWKPSQQAMLSNWVVFQTLREAGIPDGVMNFLPSTVPLFGDIVLASPHLAGLNFTGSSNTLRTLWKQVSNNCIMLASLTNKSGKYEMK